MQHNKKASAKISRRSFAKTVATSIIAAPIISAHPKKLQTQHIPPIEISSGSVTLHTQFGVSDLPESASGEQPRKQVFDRCKKIELVRVILTNGTIAIDYYKNNPAARGGQIKIWVNGPNTPKPDMVLSTPVAGGPLQIEFGDGSGKFERDSSGPTSHGRQRYNYTGPNHGISKVVIRKTNGSEIGVTTNEDREIEIDRIIVWSEQAVSNKP
jgi:hypothetical protein